MAERPGILFRFELLDALEQLDPADAGTLFVSAMRYGRYGNVPTFQNPVVSVIWPFVKSAVDRDAESYNNKTAQRRYAVYVRETRKREETPLSFDEWKLSVDIESERSIVPDIHTQSQIQSQSHTQEHTQEQVHDDGAGKPPSPRFVPPTVDEVRTYCQERHSSVNPEQFFDFYTANGWKQGAGKPIKDWRACVRTWERRDWNSTPESPAPKAKKYEIIDGEAVEVSGDV